MSTWRKSALYRRLEAIPDMTERVKTYITYVVNYYTEDPETPGQSTAPCAARAAVRSVLSDCSGPIHDSKTYPTKSSTI